MDLSTLFGWNLNKIRLDAEITQEELAHRCEIIHQGFISELERGEHSPSLNTLAILANALGVTISDLYSLKRAPSNLTAGPLVIETRRYGTKELEISPDVYGPPKIDGENPS